MMKIEETVKLAAQGDEFALEKVAKEIQGLIYNLAVKMLWHPVEAEDVTQEILIKVIVNLGTFKHESSFETWVFRVASNFLINYRKRAERKRISFDEYAMRLSRGLSEEVTYSSNKAEKDLLVIEAKVGCSNAMLQCLLPETRLVYIVGGILEFNSVEGAYILEMTAVNFRQRLSRTRRKLHAFINGNCGLVNPSNKCRCHKKIDDGIRNKFIDPAHLLFTKNVAVDELIDSIETIQTEISIHQTNPTYMAPEELLVRVKKIVAMRSLD